MIFLPPNTTSEIQPCDQGIIKTMKSYYRKSMVKSLIRAVNNGSAMSDFKITLLDSLEMIRKAWESVTPTAISNCFRRAGFERSLDDSGVDDDPFRDLDEPECDQSEGDLLNELSFDEPCTFQDYVSVDEDLQCAPLPNTKDIVGSLMQNNVNGEESDDDTGDPLPTVTYQQACSAFSEIRSFLLHSKSSENQSPYHLLNQLEAEIQRCSDNNRVQSFITDFFPSA